MKSWNDYDIYEPFDKSWSKWSKISSSWLPCEQLSKSGTQRISDNEKRKSIVEPQLHQGWFQKILKMYIILPRIRCRVATAPRLVSECSKCNSFTLEPWIEVFVKPVRRWVTINFQSVIIMQLKHYLSNLFQDRGQSLPLQAATTSGHPAEKVRINSVRSSNKGWFLTVFPDLRYQMKTSCSQPELEKFAI